MAGLVLAGSAEFKNELSESDIFDPRLKAIVLAVVDVSYGENCTFSCSMCDIRMQGKVIGVVLQGRGIERMAEV